MRIFLDECVDWRLARELGGHDVKSARDLGWTSVKNSELLARAAAQFEVFLTTDRNLSFQQNLPSIPIAVVVLCAKSNRLQALKKLTPQLEAALAGAQPGTLIEIEEQEA